MSLNQVILNGRLPRFEGTFKAAEGEKKSFLSWSISVKRDFKGKDEQYYPEDLIPLKTFGAKADFINNFFNQGDGIVLTGRLQKADDYEKDGQTVRGGLFLNVENVSFPEGKSNNGEAGASTTSTAPAKAAPAKAAPAKGGLGAKKAGGLGGKKLGGLGGKKPL